MTTALIACVAAGTVPAVAADPATTVTLGGFAFAPKRLTVPPGTTVTFVYKGEDGAPHNVHFGGDGTKLSANADGSPANGGFTKTKSFPDKGTFTYYCDIHGGPDGSGMSGTIAVGADTRAPDLTAAKAKLTKSKLKISFGLSEDARVVFTLTKKGAKKPVKRAAKSLKAGRRSLTVTRKGLGSGRYAIRIVATDAAGNVSKPAKGTLKLS